MNVVARTAAFVVLTTLLGACGATSQAPLPAVPASGAENGSLEIGAGDVAGARKARVLSYHLMPLRRRDRGAVVGRDTKIKYPADLVRRHGPIVRAAASFNVYVNCKMGGESCWGDPEGFQKDLAGSRFAQLLKQYTGSPPTAYRFGGSFSVKYRTFTNLFYQDDLLAVLHAALVKNGKRAGYANLYHIFLPKGADTCFDRSRSCYSPDHRGSFDFCAYHETVRFDDVPKIVIVSIEPYQNVSFCASHASPGASALTNSTASTLAHETFESITDPGPAFAWFNFTFFSEVADLCETFQWKISVGGTVYSLQPMYSNKYHACAAGP